jgi:hypothetical protein
MSGKSVLSELADEKLNNLKLMCGISKTKILDDCVDAFIEKRFPEYYTDKQKEYRNKKFEEALIQAEMIAYKRESCIVQNAREECLIRAFRYFADDEEIPFMHIKQNVFFAKRLIENVTFSFLVPQLLIEFTQMEKSFFDMEKFSSEYFRIRTHRKKFNIGFMTKDGGEW